MYLKGRNIFENTAYAIHVKLVDHWQCYGSPQNFSKQTVNTAKRLKCVSRNTGLDWIGLDWTGLDRKVDYRIFNGYLVRILTAVVYCFKRAHNALIAGLLLWLGG
jgi:hypothetical protein